VPQSQSERSAARERQHAYSARWRRGRNGPSDRTSSLIGGLPYCATSLRARSPAINGRNGPNRLSGPTTDMGGRPTKSTSSRRTGLTTSTSSTRRLPLEARHAAASSRKRAHGCASLKASIRQPSYFSSRPSGRTGKSPFNYAVVVRVAGGAVLSGVPGPTDRIRQPGAATTKGARGDVAAVPVQQVEGHEEGGVAAASGAGSRSHPNRDRSCWS
jgi:hypothetical protein